MFLCVWSCTVDNNGDLVANIPYANNVNFEMGVVCEILNNITNDVCKVNPEIAPKTGNDLVLFVIHWNKVR